MVTINGMKRRFIEWKETSANNAADKEFPSKIHNELLKVSGKKPKSKMCKGLE